LSSIKVQSLSNKLTEVAVIAAVLVVFLISMQIVYGLAGSLKELENEVKNETGYRSELIDFINESFSNDTLYASVSSLPIYAIDQPRQKDMQALPLFPIEQLEEIAKRIILITK
jgi:hypothetical protein